MNDRRLVYMVSVER